VNLGVAACGAVVSVVAAVDDVDAVVKGPVAGAAAYRNTLAAAHLGLASACIPAAFVAGEVVVAADN
jgi:hypothetical protein